MSFTSRPPFTGGMPNQSQQQQQGSQQNNANIGASGIGNMPLINNAGSSKNINLIKNNVHTPIFT